MYLNDVYSPIKTNKFINGETVSYSLVAFVSILSLFIFKQVFKLLFGIGASVSVLIAFIIAQLISYFLEKRFVFRKNVLSSNLKQVFLFVFRAAVNLGFYKLSEFMFLNLLEMETSFVWLVAITLCFFFNYFFDRLLLFDCAYEAKSVRYSKIYICFYRNRYIAFAGIFTAICLCMIFIGYTCFPFGDYTLMRMDLYHQYGPLFAELYDRVVNGHSLIYSWYSGGGSSFLGNYFNYLASPLTAIIFLFDRADISQAITTIIFVKCVLSAVTFTAYLKYSKNSSNYFTSIFGAFYAFSAYFLAYYWNVMWLDGMVLLPLIILGIERIINNRKFGLYVVSLAVLLISSYYIGFMTCIFSVLYFFAYMIISSGKSGNLTVDAKTTKEKLSFKNLMNNRFFSSAVYFGAGSLLAGALSAFALIPVYVVLSSSSATSGDFPQTFESYFDIFDFITSHLAGLETTIRSSGEDVLPNVYSGILTIILLPLFIVNRDIKIKEKFAYTALLLFFLFSFDNNVMNYLWHAMHFPNDLPFRYSYMYSFIILIMGYNSLSKIKSLNVKDLCFSSMLWLFFIVVAQKMSTEKMSEACIYLSIGLVIIWCGFLYYYITSKGNKQFISFLAVILAFLEIVTADISAFEIGQKNSSYKENYSDFTEAIDKIEETDDGFYREELAYLKTRMDPCYYGYNGMSAFSSMAYENYSGLQHALGMFGNRINSYTYNSQTAVYNMMFSLKYLINNSDTLSPDLRLYDYAFTTETNNTDVYENRYFLPICYCVSTDMENWITEEGDPFEIQSDYFQLATGYSGVFNTVDYLSTEFDSMNGDNVSENGTYWFYKNDEESYGSVDIKFTPSKSGNLYVYVSSSDINSIDLNSDGINTITQDISEEYILDAGYFEEGEEITLTLDCQNFETSDAYADVYIYTLDQEIFEKGYNKLKECSLKITDFSETEINGTINVKENSYLYTSIPYDEGWKIYIDGEESEIFAIGNDALLTTAIKPGNHTVTLEYKPRGVTYGLAISLTTAAGICGYYLYKKIRKKKTVSEFDINNISSV